MCVYVCVCVLICPCACLCMISVWRAFSFRTYPAVTKAMLNQLPEDWDVELGICLGITIVVFRRCMCHFSTPSIISVGAEGLKIVITLLQGGKGCLRPLNEFMAGVRLPVSQLNILAQERSQDFFPGGA